MADSIREQGTDAGGGAKGRSSVAITGASGQVGTLLRERLARDCHEFVPLGRADGWGPAVAGARAVAHLAGALRPTGNDTYRSANVDTTRAVAEAATGAGVERIVFLSYVGADPASPNEYLSSKGEAEAILRQSGVPLTVFRCVHIVGPPEHPGPTAAAFMQPGRGPVRVPGSGKQRIAPLYVADVADAVTKALTDPDAPTGTFELGGPEEMSMDELVLVLNGPQMRITHLPVPLARLIARLLPSLTPALMELLLANNVVGAGRSAAEAFGLSLHAVGELWSGRTP